MNKLITPLLLLAFNYSAFGRVGETIVQVGARYGMPTEVDDKAYKLHRSPFVFYWYQANGFKIEVIYINGISVDEEFLKFENKKTVPLTKEEIASLLSSNALNSQWLPGDREGSWKLASGKVFADITGDCLRIYTEDSISYYRKWIAKQPVKTGPPQSFQ